ncbi:MAG: peptidase M22 [Eubacterium sp.]|nr:peptidase M22 [Eubacterium sp.]
MYIGFDTSNYTTSVAAFDGQRIIQYKKMLTVKSGEKGLRQSEAVFQHTVNLPALVAQLPEEAVRAVGVSARPRNAEGSYMPCFLVGKGVAAAYAKGAGARLYTTSHQVGHILAALYSCDKLSLLQHPFLALHLSGGTTEVLLVQPDAEAVLRAEKVAESLDLKAGQAIDRAGVMLGLPFPCGKALDALSLQATAEYKIKPSMKGCCCSLSGVENKAKKLLETGESNENIAAFVLRSVCVSVDAMLQAVREQYGDLPVVFSGGVSSNTMLRRQYEGAPAVYFAAPEYSLDNAAGCAVYAYLKEQELCRS